MDYFFNAIDVFSFIGLAFIWYQNTKELNKRIDKQQQQIDKQQKEINKLKPENN